MRIVFMGTPDFAVPCLQALLQQAYDVVGVFTQPDKPKGRGYKMIPPPVKAAAVEAGLSVYQPLSLRKGEEAVDMIHRKNTQKKDETSHAYIMRLEYEPQLIVRKSTGRKF